MINYFDFHCHLDDGKLDGTREKVLIEMNERAFGALTIGVDHDSSVRATAIARTNHNIWSCVGQHPLDNKAQEFKAGRYQELIDSHREEVVAIGECGLDYFWPARDVEAGTLSEEELAEEKKRQKLLFIKNITLAIANDLPLMLHVRSSEGSVDAHEDTLAVLAEYPEVQAVFHFYTESPELAKRIIDAGYYISLPGVITFVDLDEMIRAIPLDRIFAETDSPYAAPAPYRGKTNNPLYVEEVYKKIAEIKNLPLEEVRTQILQNVTNFLQIDF